MGEPHLTSKLQGFGTTIFAEMSALAVATGAINLGQGFPDTDGPDEVRQAALDAIAAGRGNQYPPGPGRARAAPGHHRPPAALLRPRRRPRHRRSSSPAAPPRPSPPRSWPCSTTGDEAIAFEPYYDSYAACISMAGATRRPVTLPAARLRARPRRPARRGHAAHPAHPPELAPQPDRQGVRPGRARGHRRGGRRSTTCSSWPTRSTST